MPENYELDYKTMFEQLMAKFEHTLDAQNEYFETLTYMTEHIGEVTVVSENMMKMGLVDQLMFFKAYSQLAAVAVKLQEKYNFEVKEEEQEDEE